MKLLNLLLEQESYKVSYSAVVLNDKSKNEILKIVEIPDGWKIINHHMTIKLGELPEELKSEIGKTVTLKVTKKGLSDKALAVGIETTLSKNKIPHVTVAINAKGGAKPKDSNDIEDWEDLETPIYLKGRIEEVLFKPPYRTDSNPTILNVFDFDGTLMDSPTPDKGKNLYKNITGQEYPHVGWWGRLESLEPFDVKPIKQTMEYYKEYSELPNSTTILMTNRIPIFEKVVKEKLEGLYVFDYYNFKNDNREKPERISEILRNNPSIKTINIFDDMDEQIERFNIFKEQNPNLEINIFQIK